RRRILRHLHLEAVADGAAARQGDLGPLDRDPGPAARRLQFILERDAVVRTQREVRRMYVELGGPGGTIGELEYLTDRGTRAARQLEVRRRDQRGKSGGRSDRRMPRSQQQTHAECHASHDHSSSISNLKATWSFTRTVSVPVMRLLTGRRGDSCCQCSTSGAS